MIDTYVGRPSNRYCDLVDPVLIATTQTVDTGALSTTLSSELRRRGTTPTAGLSLPSEDWPNGCRKLAVNVLGLSYVDAAEAVEICPRARVTEPSLLMTKSSRHSRRACCFRRNHRSRFVFAGNFVKLPITQRRSPACGISSGFGPYQRKRTNQWPSPIVGT